MADVTAPPGAPQSVPALRARNAVQFGSKPAYREKEYGIWQTWSWAETAENRNGTISKISKNLTFIFPSFSDSAAYNQTDLFI